MTHETRTSDRRCPVCQAPMEVRKRGKVEIDACEEHGVWLEKGGLEEIERRIRHGAKLGRHASAAYARGEGKLSGILLGWLSLFVD